jgi:CBS domain-containing protein
MFIFQGAFSGAWLAFIGWFLLQGARAEARYVATEQALDGVRVRDLMVRDPVTVDADSTIGRFMDDVAWSKRFTTYPVLERGRPVGLLAFASVAAVDNGHLSGLGLLSITDLARALEVGRRPAQAPGDRG